jgi:hypothetical protein
VATSQQWFSFWVQNFAQNVRNKTKKGNIVVIFPFFYVKKNHQISKSKILNIVFVASGL